MTEVEHILELCSRSTLARASELREADISSTAISRAVEKGLLIRVGRGLYQMAAAEIPEGIQLAETSKLYPKLRIGLVSALAFHEVTDELPRQIWGVIPQGGCEPKAAYPKIKAVRMSEPHYSSHVEHHEIAGVSVPIYSLHKTLADCFRLPRIVTRSIAIDALGRTIREGKSTPSEISAIAQAHNAWSVMQPYLEALATNG